MKVSQTNVTVTRKDNMNISHQSPPTPPPLLPVIKPTFYNAVLLYNMDYPTLEAIAQTANVPQSTMDAMFTGVAIHRVDAEKILAAFSQYTGVTWTLDNVRVGLLPTFADICTKHKLDGFSLATLADLSYSIIDKMLHEMEVSERDAQLVLGIISLETGQRYSLENVDVQLLRDASEKP